MFVDKKKIILVDTNGEIFKNELYEKFTQYDSSQEDISYPVERILLVRSSSGDKKRGGYFFYLYFVEENKIEVGNFLNHQNKFTPLYTFENTDELVEFINHVSGRKFSSRMLSICQNYINFRSD